MMYETPVQPEVVEVVIQDKEINVWEFEWFTQPKEDLIDVHVDVIEFHEGYVLLGFRK